jgi:hypothetical protein
MRAHGLTEQTPKTIYLTEERTGASIGSVQLKQDAIDAAFCKAERQRGRWAPVAPDCPVAFLFQAV